MFSVVKAIVSTDERDNNDDDKPITWQTDPIVFIWDMHYLLYTYMYVGVKYREFSVK